MGHQSSRNQLSILNNLETSKLRRQFHCKTNFHYISPIQCQKDDQDFTFGQQLSEVEINTKKHQEQFQEIQNNVQTGTINTAKDLERIDEIKVKWNQFIKMKKRNYLQDYSVLKQIGRGGFGCVHKVKAKYTGLYRAAKRIKKNQLKKDEHQKLFQEMAIMISLDHPNIAKLYEVYDYKSYYVLILELCQGGELFKKIITKQINQGFAGKIMKQIIRTLIYLHKRGIVHRDLKPQNMLFESDSDTLKIIDFGIAVNKKPNQMLTSRLGTPYYIAPQVLCKNYNEKCDIWSAGVILFMMMSGYPPFRGDNQYEVMQNVLKESLSFKGPAWNKVTYQCKELIALMLNKNQLERPNALEAYEHPWIKAVSEKMNMPQDHNVLANIRGFSFENKLQAVVYTYIVSQLLTSDEKKFLFHTFQQLDKNNDGVIETQQLIEAFKSKKDVSEQRVKFLMRIIDTNGSGHIDYTQFLVAGINPQKFLTQHHFQQAFQYFDIDHSGAITFEQIAHFLQDSKESEQSIKKIFQQVDENNDGNISKQQFVKLLMKQTRKYNCFSEQNGPQHKPTQKNQKVSTVISKKLPIRNVSNISNQSGSRNSNKNPIKSSQKQNQITKTSNEKNKESKPLKMTENDDVKNKLSKHRKVVIVD